MASAYPTLQEFRDWIDNESLHTDEMTAALAASVSSIEKYCNRTFLLDGSATARKYRTENPYSVAVDDIGDAASIVLKTDDNEDGVFETTRTDYFYEPANVTDKPITRLTINPNATCLPYNAHGQYLIEVTAKWGWPSVPDDIYLAVLIGASRYFKRRESPGGVLTTNNFGLDELSRFDPDLRNLINPYRIKYPRIF